MDFSPIAPSHTAPFRIVKSAAVTAQSSSIHPQPCEALGGSDSINVPPFASERAGAATDSANKAMGSTATESALTSSKVTKSALTRSEVTKTPSKSAVLQDTRHKAGDWKFFGTSVNQNLKVDDVVAKMNSGRLMVVNSRRRNGLIVLREFHAEFAGPGAAIGGGLDDGVVGVIPIGDLSLLEPDSHEEHQNAIKIRLQWIRLTQNFTDQPSPDDRARMILEQFKTYFDKETVNMVPDEAFALLVGVFPQTIHNVRSGFVW